MPEEKKAQFFRVDPELAGRIDDAVRRSGRTKQEFLKTAAEREVRLTEFFEQRERGGEGVRGGADAS